MADTKISAMTAATTLGDTDELVLAVAGANKKITGANLKASIPGTGGGTFAGTRLYQSPALTLASASSTLLTWNGENFDTDAFHSTGSNTDRITVPTGKGGYYHFGFNLSVANMAANTYVEGWVTFNDGADICRERIWTSVTGEQPCLSASAIYALAAGDFINMYARQSDSVSRTTSVQLTFLWAYKIG